MAPRSANQLAALRDQRRERILDSALVVFARQGLEATKVTDLAAAAGMSQGLLYRYFPSKEAVYGALVERVLEGSSRLAAQALRRPGTAWDRLHWLCTAMLDGVREHPQYVALISFASGPQAPPEAQAAVARNGHVTFELVVRLLAEGQASGHVGPGHPAELARAFFALIQGLALRRAQDEGGADAFFPSPDVVLRLFCVCATPDSPSHST